MLRRAAPALALALLAAGCAEPRVVPIVGPDGTRMLHVSCGEQEGECYRLAGEACPYGYDVGRTVAGPGNMLVRCRVPVMAPAYPAAYAASPAAEPGARLPGAVAPPPAPSVSSRATPAAPPSAIPSAAASSAPPFGSGELDLGY